MPHRSSLLTAPRSNLRRLRRAALAVLVVVLVRGPVLPAQVATPVLTGIVKGSVVTEGRTPLFRNTPRAFQVIFSWSQKYITKGYVSQALACDRLAQVVADDAFAQSGVHWSWGNRQQVGCAAFAQPLTARASEEALGRQLWELSARCTGLHVSP
jgi:hypothetical protein